MGATAGGSITSRPSSTQRVAEPSLASSTAPGGACPSRNFLCGLTVSYGKKMSLRICVACVAALLPMSLAPGHARAQGPDLPPIPRLSGICHLADGPKRGWASATLRSLGVRVSHPPEWSARESTGPRIEFVTGDRVMARLWAVDTGGVAPAAWLERQDRTAGGGRCQTVVLGGSRGRQCFDPTTGTWTTFLIAAHRVIAVEAPGTLSRETHCGILMSVREGP